MHVLLHVIHIKIACSQYFINAVFNNVKGRSCTENERCGKLHIVFGIKFRNGKQNFSQPSSSSDLADVLLKGVTKCCNLHE